MNDFINDASVSKDVLKRIVDNREYNNEIYNYYSRFMKTGGSVAFQSDLLDRKRNSISNCNKTWIFDHYKEHKVKDFVKTYLCRDKFCSNCKKVKQAGRMVKYIPIIEPYKDNLYHLVLTVPSVFSESLRTTIKHMSKCFKMLMNYIRGYKKIRGLDFTSWGYEGAIRSLEVTFKGNKYHPHYHVALCLNSFLFRDEDRKIINQFSYSYGVLKRLFHPTEILLQKIWYLLINNKTVNIANINFVEVGYSCTIDKFVDNDYAELFKYITKEVSEDGNVLTYYNFIGLYFGLYSIKQIQGYGIFYNMVSDDIDLDSFEQIYEEFIEMLKEKESPTVSYDRPSDLYEDDENIIISRKSYFKYLMQVLQEDS